MTELIKTYIPFGANSAQVTFTAASGADYFTADNSDSRIFLVAKNSNAQSATVTIKAGDGALCALGNANFTVGPGAEIFIPMSRVESARVKILSGEDKGKIYVLTAAETGGAVGNVSIAVVSVE